MKISNVDRYLDAVVNEYDDECEADSYPNTYECKKKLWKCAVIVWESDPEPDDRIDELRAIALDYGLKATDIGSTIASAQRKASSHA